MRRRSIAPRTWYLLASLPAIVVFWVSATFVWNHFVEWPYLLDSGWCSALVFRQGFFQKNPAIIGSVPDFWGIHVSLVMSLASVVSVAFPGDRVDWYVLFQGFLYAPLGIATPYAVGRGASPSVRDAALVAAVSLAFALDGQVLACIGFPHYEILVSGGLCLMLAGLASGRRGFAWAGLALAAATREDGGFHAAAFVVGVLACNARARRFPVSRAELARMAAVGALASVLAFAAARAFVTVPLFRVEYLGAPPFAHLDGASLARRARGFLEHGRFVALPLAGTIVVAIATRDARWLVGWLVELPWLALNFFAAQELKSTFALYTGFPFVASVFWVAAYGRVSRLERPRRAALGILFALSALSTIGLASADPGGVARVLRAGAAPARGRSAILAFVKPLRANPTAYGRIVVDDAVASWALERLPYLARAKHRAPADLWRDVDAFAFFRTRDALELLARSPLDACGRAPGTSIFLCVRAGKPLPAGLLPSSPILAEMQQAPGTGFAEGETRVVEASRDVRPSVYGPYVTLPPGAYVATWTVAPGPCSTTDGPRLRVDVAGVGAPRALEVTSFDAPIAIPFDVEGPEPAREVELRAWTGACRYVLSSVDLRLRDGVR